MKTLANANAIDHAKLNPTTPYCTQSIMKKQIATYNSNTEHKSAAAGCQTFPSAGSPVPHSAS